VPGARADSLPGMSTTRIFRDFRTSPDIIRLGVMMDVRYPLPLHSVEDLLHERGIDITHETERFWGNRLGQVSAAQIRRNRVQANATLAEVRRSPRLYPRRFWFV
jgi:transposase-like protein